MPELGGSAIGEPEGICFTGALSFKVGKFTTEKSCFRRQDSHSCSDATPSLYPHRIDGVVLQNTVRFGLPSGHLCLLPNTRRRVLLATTTHSCLRSSRGGTEPPRCPPHGPAQLQPPSPTTHWGQIPPAPALRQPAHVPPASAGPSVWATGTFLQTVRFAPSPSVRPHSSRMSDFSVGRGAFCSSRPASRILNCVSCLCSQHLFSLSPPQV